MMTLKYHWASIDTTYELPEGRLLFDRPESALTAHAELCFSQESFYENGFTVIPDVRDQNAARTAAAAFLVGLNARRAPWLASFLPRVRLATQCRIPNTTQYAITPFQALHFDMGNPICWTPDQPCFVFSALYVPREAEKTGAKTRLIAIDKIRTATKQPWQEDIAAMENRLVQYVDRYGDGWNGTQKFSSRNTHTLACFARVIDALSGRNELLHFFDMKLSEWFAEGISAEYAFYRSCGIDMENLVSFVELQPGDLLIMDNLRMIHGRSGLRSSRQIWHTMFGVEQAEPGEVEAYRKHLCRTLSC